MKGHGAKQRKGKGTRTSTASACRRGASTTRVHLDCADGWRVANTLRFARPAATATSGDDDTTVPWTALCGAVAKVQISRRGDRAPGAAPPGRARGWRGQPRSPLHHSRQVQEPWESLAKVGRADMT